MQFVRTRWANDPFARGASSYLPLGATSADRLALAAPMDGVVFFAGEATSSTHPATVHGAVESGRRAVSELVAAGARASERVVVIGAGAAGLAAAAELRTAGFAPVVLDARDRVGGRAHTDTTLGLAVDLGATWVHDALDATALVALARQGGVTLDAFADTPALRDRNGRLRRDAATVHDQLTAALARVGAGTQAEAELAGAVANEARRAGLRDPELAYAITSEVEHALGAAATEISWRGFDDGRAAHPGHALPRGGFAALLAPLAVGIDIRLRTVVTRVEWSRARNRVVADSGEVPFDRLVVTVPLGVLQAGSPIFEPPLPVSKTHAIGRLGVGLVDKLVLRFDEVFWDRDAPRIGFVGTTPGEWVAWLNLFPFVGEPILVGFNAALVARSFDARTDEQVLASAMSALRAMYH